MTNQSNDTIKVELVNPMSFIIRVTYRNICHGYLQEQKGLKDSYLTKCQHSIGDN